jgi:hypothetical protein
MKDPRLPHYGQLPISTIGDIELFHPTICTCVHNHLPAMSTKSRSPESEESEEEREPEVWDEDGYGKLIAVFILDDIPVEVSLHTLSICPTNC